MSENYSTHRIHPKLRHKVQQRASIPSGLPPMPALDKLVPQVLEIGEQPTLPMAVIKSRRALLTEQSTYPQALTTSRPLPSRQSSTPPARAKVAGTTELKGGHDFEGPTYRLAPRQSHYKNSTISTIRTGSTRLKKRGQPRRLKPYIILLLLLLIIALACWGLYTLSSNLVAPLGQFFHPISGESDGSIDGRAWNLLLLGSDDDHKFVFPEVLTQVIMVVHVDPQDRSVSLVSIPRDSWVPVPGDAHMQKIDQAFYLGSTAHDNFDDGVRMARATIEQDYGITIDRYAWVGLDGFASVIDTLGGIDIDVTHPIVDDNYPNDTNKNAADPYAVKRIYLAPGPQHLTGNQALEYVRSRHADLIGDIGRTKRQQEVLTALKKKLNAPTIFNHLSALFHDLTGHVYTDLSESEMLSVANFARDLPANAIGQITLGPGQGSQNYGALTSVKDPGLDQIQDVILPNCTNIQPLINHIFDLGALQSCQMSA